MQTAFRTNRPVTRTPSGQGPTPDRRGWRATLAAGLLAATALAGAAHAQAPSAAQIQAYPDRPVRFIVPYPVGGAAELFTRTMAAKLTEALGKQVYVDSRAGANAIIGTQFAARSAPDGYTLYMGAKDALIINPSVYRNLPYDPITDFAPISVGTLYPYVLIVHPSLGVNSIAELVALAKTKPGVLGFASAGFGSSPHLAGEFMAYMAGIKLLHVPYKGSGPALTDVLGGQVPMMFNTIPVSNPHIQAGKVRVLAITDKRRSAQLPNVPTLDELGYKGGEVTTWQGVLAPAGTPRPIIDKLHKAVVAGLRAKDMVDLFSVQGGAELVGNTPEEFAALIKADFNTYSSMIKAAGIPLQELAR